MGIVVPVAVVSFLSVFLVFFIIQRRKKRDTYEDEGKEGKIALHMLLQSDFLTGFHCLMHHLLVCVSSFTGTAFWMLV